MYTQEYFEAFVQQRHAEALRDAQMRGLAMQAKGSHKSPFSTGWVMWALLLAAFRVR